EINDLADARAGRTVTMRAGNDELAASHDVDPCTRRKRNAVRSSARNDEFRNPAVAYRAARLFRPERITDIGSPREREPGGFSNCQGLRIRFGRPGRKRRGIRPT